MEIMLVDDYCLVIWINFLHLLQGGLSSPHFGLKFTDAISDFSASGY